MESRLSEKNFELEQERQLSAALEMKVSDLQWSRGQLEATVQRAASDVGGLQKELGDLKKKIEHSEYRANALSSLSDSLLKILNNVSAASAIPKEDTVNLTMVHTELNRQQEIIHGLEQCNRRQEDSIQALRATLDATLFGDSYCSSLDDSDSTTILGTANGISGSDIVNEQQSWLTE